MEHINRRQSDQYLTFVTPSLALAPRVIEQLDRAKTPDEVAATFAREERRSSLTDSGGTEE
jgi:hypothetical protein